MAPHPLDPDPEQHRALEERDGTILVLGGAGTGKTSLLGERFARAIEAGADPDRIALVVRSKRAREQTRAALLERLGRSLSSLRVTTVHGLAFALTSERFEALGYREPPEVLDSVGQFGLVQELLRDEAEYVERWPAYGALLRLRGFADEVRQLVLRAQERLLTPEEMQAAADRRGLGGWPELARFYARYLEEVRARGVLDFAGVILRASEAASVGRPAFDEVLVDDYQDATLASERLLGSLRTRTLVIAGNEAAHVYSFQGTTVEPLRRLSSDPSVVRVRLATNHRTTSSPIAIDAWTAAHGSEEHRAIARELRRVHVEERVPWRELAVIVRRQSGDVEALVRALDDADIPRETTDPGLSPAASPATRPYVLALRWLVAPTEWRDENIEVLLTSELGGITPPSARAMLRIARARGAAPSEALGVEETLSAAERRSLSSLRDALAAAERVTASAEDAMRVLWKRLPWSARLVVDAEVSDQARTDLAAVHALTRSAAAAASGPDPGVAAFVASLGVREGAPEPASTVEGKEVVHVLTAHAAVGMEFDTVIVAGAEEGDFPSVRRPEPMFDLDALARAVSRSELNRARIADERRLFQMVVARARRRVLLTVSRPHGADPTGGLASRFADELGVSWVPAPAPPFGDAVSVDEAAAGWRRELAGAAPNAALRLAALDGLLALGVDPGRWWFRREWTRPLPRTDELRLSFSRLGRLENCDLQFALGEELGLDPGGGYKAWVGRLVHGLIEAIEKGEVERTREAFVAALESRWQPERFPSYAISEAERRHAVEVLIPNWFERYGDLRAEEDGTERSFAFDLAGATIRGKIDRIGPAPGSRRRITDFKTGTADGAGDPAENLQLGIYYLAVGECEDLEAFRPIDAVELAFLGGTKSRSTPAKPVEWSIDPKGEADYAQRMRERVVELVGRVRALASEGSYTASTAADCFFCSFQTLCSRYAQGHPVFEDAVPTPVIEAARA